MVRPDHGTAVSLAVAVSPDLLVMGPTFALAGAGSAAGSLALARMGEDRESLGRGGDVGRLG